MYKLIILIRILNGFSLYLPRNAFTDAIFLFD